MNTRAHILIRLKLDGWKQERKPGNQIASHQNSGAVRMVKGRHVKYIELDGNIHDYVREMLFSDGQ